MLRELWNKLAGGTDAAIERETELEELGAAGRTHAEEGVEGYRADRIAGERSAGLDYSHFDDDV